MMTTRAERRRLQRELNKSMGGLSKEQIDRIIEERMSAQQLVDVSMRKFEGDVYAKYERQYLASCKAAEDKYRRIYDERTKIPKTELKKEVVGDVMTMFFWTMRDHFGFESEQLHKIMLEFIRLEACMQEHEKLGCITINDIVDKMNQEGYDMKEDLRLVDEMVDAEFERYHELLGQPYVQRGSVNDKWRPSEDKRLQRLVKERRDWDYTEIALIMGRSEAACKNRVRRLYGTQTLERIRGGAA